MPKERMNIDWFKNVFNENYEYVRNYLFYLSGDMDLSEDLSQDVFMKIWEKQNDIKNKSIKSYLFTIAKNLYFNNHKRKSIELKFKNTVLDNSDNESPEYLMEVKEFDDKLQLAISSLPERCRTIFLMNRMDEMKYSEIAEILEISVKAVEKQMTKALGILRNSISQKI